MKYIIIFGCMLLLLLFAMGCNEQEVPTSISERSFESSNQDPLQKPISNDPIEFIEGRSTFGAYLPRTNEVLLDPNDMWCPATATLNFGEGQEITLILEEGPPCSRTSILKGKMTPSGSLKLVVPDWWVDEITEHTGCTPSGTLPVYHGNFDGQRLYASTHFHGLCTGGTMWGPGLGVSEEMGPINVKFEIILEVD